MRPAFRHAAQLVLLLISSGALSPLVAQENKLEAYRQHLKEAVSNPTESIVGEVDHVSRDSVATSISTAQLQQQGIGQNELLTVAIGGKTFVARTIDRDSYLELQDQKHVRQMLDVDVVCVVDSALGLSFVSVVGLSGGFVDWLKPYPGSVVTLTRMH